MEQEEKRRGAGANRSRRPERRRQIEPVSAVLAVLMVLGIGAYLSGGLTVHHGNGADPAEIETNVQWLAQTAAQTPLSVVQNKGKQEGGIHVEDLAAEQKKILEMDTSSVDRTALARRFSEAPAVILGDSITYAAYEYSWVDESIIKAKIGASVAGADELFERAKQAQPAVVFLCFGMNDIESYTSNVDGFLEDYRSSITDLQSALPDAVIYVQGLLPAEDGKAKSFYQYLDEYNRRLEELCTELGVTWFDSSFLLEEKPELYDADGIHPVGKFYGMWLTYLADVAGLGEESSDTGSETQETQPPADNGEG